MRPGWATHRPGSRSCVMLTLVWPSWSLILRVEACRLGECRPPGRRVDLGAVRMSRAALADQPSGLGVPDHYLAGLGRGVDPGDQAHRASIRCSSGELVELDETGPRSAAASSVVVLERSPVGDQLAVAPHPGERRASPARPPGPAPAPPAPRGRPGKPWPVP